MNREPDEPPPRDSAPEPGPGGGPLDDFDRIVSRWRLDGSVPEWPDDEGSADPGPDPAPTADIAVVVDGAPTTDNAATPDPVAPPAAASSPEDHFVPPEPPPLPRLGPPALVGLVLLGLGIVLVASPAWIGIPAPYGPPLGLLALAGGLGWLVLRLWPPPPPVGDGDGEDDGAVL